MFCPAASDRGLTRLRSTAMPELVPSYLKKLTRAEKHLADLKVEIDRYLSRHPYEVVTTVTRREKAHRLEFTSFPENTDIGIIAADVVYNLRSGLDHLAAALVPRSYRSHVMFPIFWRGVWEDAVQGEGEQRARDRERWNTSTRKMKSGAVECLKTMQPREVGDYDRIVNFLSVLNRLSNTDRHKEFPLMVTALKRAVVSWRDANGLLTTGHDPATDDPDAGVNNHSEIRGVPDDATEVKILGAPVIVVRVSQPKGEFVLDEMLGAAIPTIREHAIAPLVPYLYVPKYFGRAKRSDRNQ